MADERKAEDFHLLKPSMADEDGNMPAEGTTGYDLAKKSYDVAMEEYNERLDHWLKTGEAPGVAVTPAEDE